MRASGGIGLPALVLLILINLLWAGSQVAAKAALTAFGPFTLTVVRFFPAGLLLLALSRLKRKSLPIRRADWPGFFGLAFLGIALTYGIFYIGLDRTTATDSSPLFACEPILIALFARLFLGERPGGQQWSGMLLGLAGIWLIVGQTLGNRIALLALCFEATTSILGKRLTRDYPGLQVVGTQMVIGSLMLLPIAVWETARHAPVVSWQAVGGWLYLSLICSAFCYGVWYRLLSRLPVSELAVFILIQPMAGPIYGRLFRGETLSEKSALGGMLVVAGILLTTLRKRRKEDG